MLKLSHWFVSIVTCLFFSGCGGGGGGGSGEAKSPAPEIILASIVATENNLPSCSSSTENYIFFVKDVIQLKQCRTGTYHDIDLSNKGVTLLPDGANDGQTVVWSASEQKWIDAPLLPGTTSSECSMTVKEGYMVIGLIEGNTITVSKIGEISNGRQITVSDATCMSGTVVLTNPIVSVFSCETDFYNDGTNACIAVGNGFYRPAGTSNPSQRFACSVNTIGASSANFTSSGNGADNCSYDSVTCGSGYANSNSLTCVASCDGTFYSDDSSVGYTVSSLLDGQSTDITVDQASNGVSGDLNNFQNGYIREASAHITCNGGAPEITSENVSVDMCDWGYYQNGMVCDQNPIGMYNPDPYGNPSLIASCEVNNPKIDQVLFTSPGGAGDQYSCSYDIVSCKSGYIANGGSCINEYTDVALVPGGTFFLKPNGKVDYAGYNQFDGTNGATQPSIVSVATPFVDIGTVTGMLGTNSGTVCFKVLDSGVVKIKCMGYNGSGEVGVGTVGDIYSSHPENNKQTISNNNFVAGLNAVKDLAVSGKTFCAIADNAGTDVVKCWGAGENYLTGQGNTTNIGTPAIVAGTNGATAIFGGGSSFCAKMNDLSVKCWGKMRNDSSTETTYQNPTSIPMFDGADKVYVGAGSTCVSKTVSSDTQYYCVGTNDSGDLGLDWDHSGWFALSLIPELTNAAALFKGGYNRNFAILQGSGEVVAYGYNNQNGLGIPSGADSYLFMNARVQNLSNARKVVIAPSGNIACSVYSPNNDTHTSVKCWGGGNNSGQMATGSTFGYGLNSATQVQ
ncbi:RCC1 domain-containing protein [Bdellovibrio sp. BCCA]|uniref:RCC1 domain-containing protein n=1 Tax=Bdellovibrio sp. BCCA TaxID=3136281 RepID=UPI0030F1CA5C